MHNRGWYPTGVGLALALAGLSSSGAGQVVTVTLDDALRLASQNSPGIVQADGDIQVAEAAKRESLGDWLPSLSGSSGWSRNSSQRFDERTQTTISGANSSMSASLSTSFTIFDGFRRNAQGRSRNADLASAEANYISQEFGVALQTKQAFFQAVAAQELVRVSETRIERAQRQLQITRDRLAAGSAIRSDTLQSFVESANARLQLINAQTQLATASANLARLIGVDGEVQAVDSGIVFVAELDTAAVREEALTNGPSVHTAIAQARAADAQVGVSRAQYFPTLSASYNRSFSGADIGSLNPSWTARLSFSWPIFNGFTRETQIARARASQDAAAMRVDDTRRQVNAQLTQQFAALRSAAVRIEIAQASLVAAEEDLRVQQERYRLGAATIVEVMNSQVNLDQAAVDIVQARLDFLLAKAQIEALVGREL